MKGELYLDFLKAVRTVWVLRGSAIFFYIQLLFSRNLIKVKAPGWGGPIWLRKGTSDIDVFYSVVSFSEFGFPFKMSDKPIIVDAGANTGISARFFASRYPTATVYAIEPDKENFAMLERNTKPCKNIVPVHAALAGKDGVFACANPSSESWARQYRVNVKDSGSDSVEAVSLSTLLKKHAISTVNLLKIDIEGAEKEVFAADCAGWIDAVSTICIELHDSEAPGCSRAFYRAISQRQFTQNVRHEKVIVEFT
jgi:FkbM family methyltransferase